MKKNIIKINDHRGIAQITTTDERWYTREIQNPVTGLPVMDYRPSITFIGGFYPKGKGFEIYLKKAGEGADDIVQAAAERGSKVHQAIEALNKGEKVKITSKFLNNRTDQLEELAPDEYKCVMDYCTWWREEGSKELEILEAEKTVWPEGKGSEVGGPLHFAGTLDLLVRRKSDGAIGVIDIKTSKEVYTSHIIQLSALREGKIAEGVKVEWQAILQVGHRNKCGYKFSLQEHRFDLFLHAKGICEYETSGERPLEREFPLELSLGKAKDDVELVVPKEQVVDETYEDADFGIVPKVRVKGRKKSSNNNF